MQLILTGDWPVLSSVFGYWLNGLDSVIGDSDAARKNIGGRKLRRILWRHITSGVARVPCARGENIFAPRQQKL